MPLDSHPPGCTSRPPARHWLELLSCELQLAVMEFVDGKSAVRASVALRAWRRVLLASCPRCELWWKETTVRELGLPALRAQDATMWRARFARLQARPVAAQWLGSTHRHGLRDRVAAPQMFIGATGRKLFVYGGWTRLGPQTDLLACATDTIAAWAVGARRGGSADAAHIRFERCLDSGRPVARGGVQTLTPLWLACAGRDRPSRAHVARTLRDLVSDVADYQLVVIFGGAGGGYHNEHNDWRVAGISESTGTMKWTTIGSGRRRDDSTAQAITARCAHTATYVPARLSGGREGHVFVIGGHTDNCSRSLASVDCLDIDTWQWDVDVATGPHFRGRHGHSATLVELDGRGYIVVVGGGTGNILHGFGIQEFDDCWVLDVFERRWLAGPIQLGAADALGVPFGRHHTASSTLHGQTLLFGGGSRPSNTLGLFDARACAQRALLAEKEPSADDDESTALREPLLVNLTAGQPHRELPSARKMHAAACLLPWLPLFVCLGGWETGPHFSDMWLADLLTPLGPLPDDSCSPPPHSQHPTQHVDDEEDESVDDESDEDDEANLDHIVTLNIATEAGVHQIRVPRRAFIRLVSDGLIGIADPQQHEDPGT